MLSVKKIHAGRAAVDYYLNQTRRGLADYYLADQERHAGGTTASRRLTAPGSSWWGGSAEALGLSGEVERAQFVPLYAKGVRPDGGYLGRRFRLPEEADEARRAALAAASEIVDPYERWMAKHDVRRRGGRASVAAWDCTFSPPKSVSLLWAAGESRVQREVWGAHTAAVDAGLRYLEQHASYVRAGAQGVRVLDTDGLVVARMNEWTSRDGDMHLHTHCLVLNRARTCEDGTWRALDGRALLSARTGAGALYNRTLEAELTRRLGVAWRDRPDGLRELDGVDDDLIAAFSSRRRAITDAVQDLASAYRDKYGIDPPPAVLNAMGQTAWARTRRRKGDPDPAGALEQWEATARRHGRELARLPRHVLGRRTTGQHIPADDGVAAMFGRLAAGGQATFSRHDLLRAALDVIDVGTANAEELKERAGRLVDQVADSWELVEVSAPDLLVAPAELRRADGTSVYVQPTRGRWTLRATLEQETWLLDIAIEPAGPPVDATVIEAAVTTHELGVDQAEAVREMLGTSRRLALMVGPAGAGKTRTLRAVADAWHQTGRQAVGLTVSQAAAQVLAAEAGVNTANTAKWLHEIWQGRWEVPDGALVIVDEASMVSTDTVVEIVEQARRANGKVLLVGDPAQLSAIHIGGAFDLLADRHGAARLREVRRFVEPWEAHASQLLRRRDPAALAEYAMRNRIHGGTRTEVETGLFDAWRTDALATTDPYGRRSALMIVTTNEQAAVLSERARHTLIAAGAVSDGHTVRLRDNVASVGDHVVTRRNDRRLRTSNRGFVVNGDIWTVIATYADGAADLRRHSDGATTTLPADYLAEHAHLGYATTAHRAQGMTVDVCHAAVTTETGHETLYVAATRGRAANHLWVAIDTDRDTVVDPDDLPGPEHVLSRVLERHAPDRLSAHQAIETSLSHITGLARLGQVFEDAARTATDEWLRRRLDQHGLTDAATADQWPTLVTAARHAALAGHDLDRLVDHAVGMRPIDDAHSTAAVLHWRLTSLTDSAPPVRPRGPLASLPPASGPHIELAQQAAQLIRQRWRDVRATLTIATGPIPWATALGPPPVDAEAHAAWLTAATAITAYRERFGISAHQTMTGPRPGPSRPDAQAAWDHAQHQTDRCLARRLRHLTDTQLAELDARQHVIITGAPPFDPVQLQTAWNAQGHGPELPGAEIRRREDAARRHREWREARATATGLRRAIHVEQQRRTSRQTARGRAAR